MLKENKQFVLLNFLVVSLIFVEIFRINKLYNGKIATNI